MELKTLSIINVLFASFLSAIAPANILIGGYEFQSYFAAVIGALIGTIILVIRSNKNILVWTAMGIFLVLFVFEYPKVWELQYVPGWLSLLCLLAIFFFFVIAFYVLSFFEIYVYRILKSPKSD